MAGSRKRRFIAAAVLAAAVILGGIVLYGRSTGGFLPRWVRWESGAFFSEAGGAEIRLEKRRVRLFYEGRCFWTSPPELRVQNVLSCDIDGDGTEELLLLCWKKGRYGTSRPFWVQNDETDWSQHIFVYEYDHESVRAQWMSSYMGVDAADFHTEETADNGRSRFCLLIEDPEGKKSRWFWDFWGFTRAGQEQPESR